MCETLTLSAVIFFIHSTPLSSTINLLLADTIMTSNSPSPSSASSLASSSVLSIQETRPTFTPLEPLPDLSSSKPDFDEEPEDTRADYERKRKQRIEEDRLKWEEDERIRLQQIQEKKQRQGTSAPLFNDWIHSLLDVEKATVDAERAKIEEEKRKHNPPAELLSELNANESEASDTKDENELDARFLTLSLSSKLHDADASKNYEYNEEEAERLLTAMQEETHKISLQKLAELESLVDSNKNEAIRRSAEWFAAQSAYNRQQLNDEKERIEEQKRKRMADEEAKRQAELKQTESSLPPLEDDSLEAVKKRLAAMRAGLSQNRNKSMATVTAEQRELQESWERFMSLIPANKLQDPAAMERLMKMRAMFPGLKKGFANKERNDK